MAGRVKPSKKSSNPRTTGDHPGQSNTARTQVARAYREDTPEAHEQQRRLPKTHPTRSPSAARKDKDQKPKRGRLR